MDNLRTYKGHNGLPIDRTTVWGNPFVMRADTPAERARVCQQFRRWWYLNAQKPLRKRARKELNNKVLLCVCHPKPCHGLTIASYIEMMKRKKGRG